MKKILSDERVDEILAELLNEDGMDAMWETYGDELNEMDECEIRESCMDYLTAPIF